MSTVHSAAPRRRRRLGALGMAVLVGASGTLVAAAPAITTATPVGADEAAPVSAVSLDWGVRASFRNYLSFPFVHGTTTTDGGATVNGDGTFNFPGTAASISTDGSTTQVDSTGSVHLTGHPDVEDVPVLDLEFSDPRVVIDGSSASLVVDAVSRPFVTTTTPEPPVVYDDVAIATLDLAGGTVTNTGNTRTWSDVPTTLTAEGAPAFGDFYPAGDPLDPVTFSIVFNPELSFSKTTGINPNGETVTVTGTGFNPNATISSRAPVTVGQPSGFYLVFGKFQDVWQPSTGAAGGARQVIDQKWPLPEASKNQVSTAFPSQAAQLVLLNADGSFTTTLFVRDDPTKTNPNYGIATYSASTANYVAAVETFTPVTFDHTPGQLRARILDDAGAPIAGARAVFYDATTLQRIDAGSSSNQGGIVKSLAPGRYKVEFKATGHLTSFSGGASDLASASAITVDPGVATPFEQVTLSSSVKLRGTVTNAATSAPLGSVRVNVYRASDCSALLHQTITRADGTYVIANLPAGDYKVQFKHSKPSQWITDWVDSEPGSNCASASTVHLASAAVVIDHALTPVAPVPL